MTVGIPQSLSYYRYGVLWEEFFRELDISVALSVPTNGEILAWGTRLSVDEICLPAKLYLGHVASLRGRCDAVLVPRLQQIGKKEEFCVRFWGLYDMVRATLPDLQLLTYEIKSGRQMRERSAFLQLGRIAGKTFLDSARAYQIAERALQAHDEAKIAARQAEMKKHGAKILIAAQSYIARDPYLGGMVADLVRAGGGAPLFADGWEKRDCRAHFKALSTDLYWITNQEILGAIELAKECVDGIILLTAFPCGSDCLANELVLRRMRGVPLLQILLDEHQGQAGLATRVESFLDMIVRNERFCLPNSLRQAYNNHQRQDCAV